MIGMFLGMAFVLIREPVYTGVYGSGERRGVGALADQQTAGAMMVALDILIMMFALAFFFWHAAQQHDRDEAAAGGREASGAAAEPTRAAT
jgi:putative copper resistance protein D